MGRRDEYEEDEEELELVLFQGALNGVDANLKENQRLVHAGLVPAKELVTDALEQRAETVLVEPKAGRIGVRFLVDGVAYPGRPVHPKRAVAIVQTLKLLAGLDITNRKSAQSGGIKADFQDHPYHVFVDSTPIPGSNGAERLRLRIEDLKLELSKPAHLGFTDHLKNWIREHTSSQSGIILVCGPPQSGTSVTTFVTIHTIDAYLYSIYSMTDVGTKDLNNVNSFERDEEVALDATFEQILRKEANVLFLAPLQDPETAKTVFEYQNKLSFVAEIPAADPPAAVAQLVEWLEDPQLVVDGLRGVITQKLIRTLCSKCKERFRPNPKLLARVGLPAGTKVLCRKGEPPEPEKNEEIEPCEKCGDIGYHGRQAAFELLEMTDEMKDVVLQGGDAAAIREKMRADGMQTLQKDGLRLVAGSQTSLEELQRIFSGKKKKRTRRR
ncbi:MAG: ATPase, T2SS/T4P/T4SS family [Planctomycetaceae bacterium]